MAETEWLTADKDLLLSVDGNTITLEIVVGDDYEAQILFEDLYTRLAAGEGLYLKCQK